MSKIDRELRISKPRKRSPRDRNSLFFYYHSHAAGSLDTKPSILLSRQEPPARLKEYRVLTN